MSQISKSPPFLHLSNFLPSLDRYMTHSSFLSWKSNDCQKISCPYVTTAVVGTPTSTLNKQTQDTTPVRQQSTLLTSSMEVTVLLISPGTWKPPPSAFILTSNFPVSLLSKSLVNMYHTVSRSRGNTRHPLYLHL